jgi:hypothetical protein
MFIWKDTLKRCNPAAKYTSPDGTRYTRVPADLYEEIPDPIPPADFSDETYYRTEQDDAPYVVFTRKSDEQLAAIWWEKVKQQRDELTDNGGCLVGDKWFHTDAKSKQQQMALMIMSANLPSALLWKTMDGTFVEMTPSLAQSIFIAQVMRESQIFNIAENAKIAPFTDITWPARYTKSN